MPTNPTSTSRLPVDCNGGQRPFPSQLPRRKSTERHCTKVIPSQIPPGSFRRSRLKPTDAAMFKITCSLHTPPKREARAICPKATETLKKDRESLLAFYDFPAEHWQHLRMANAVESTFAIVRHRTTRTRTCLSRPTFLGLAFKLVMEAEKT